MASYLAHRHESDINFLNSLLAGKQTNAFSIIDILKFSLNLKMVSTVESITEPERCWLVVVFMLK